MSLQVSRSRVLSSLKDLNARWQKVCVEWDDPVRRKFQIEFVDPLERRVRSAVSAMERMHEIVSRAKRECG